MTVPPEQRRITVSLVAWALGFCLLTGIAAIGGMAAAGLERKALPSVLATMWNSPAVVADALHYLVAYAGIHVLAALAWSWAWSPLGERLVGPAQRHRLAVASFLPLLLLVLLANARWFPGSLFSPQTTPAISVMTNILFWLLTAYMAGVSLAGTWLRMRTAMARGVAGVSVIALLGAWWIVDTGSVTAEAPPRAQPDVIMVGIDGLRPDHVDPVLTPALAGLLEGSVWIEHAWTPLARTFPAWVSVLTGQYPATHGAYFNLLARDLVDDSDSLAHQFGELGYQRFYAIDETRFSNMDESFGFDLMAGPPIGAFDFLMSAMGDLPAVNLLAGTPAGRYLFPYAHANRALGFSYRPETFDRMLARGLRSLDPERPLFLVAHFELPHWPFTWADAGDFGFDAPAHLAELSTPSYRRTVARVDRQLAELLEVLERTGRLRDSALVVLSDHGEAFTGLEPRWRRYGDAPGAVQPHGGHGTHVLSAAQYRVLLAFRGYGEMGARVEPAHVRDATASLVDVRPTLHDWLGIPVPAPVTIDGESLWPLLTGGRAPVDRAVMLETGFSPPSVAAGAPDPAGLVADAARYYDVGGDGRLTLRHELLQELRERKQRAVVMGAWILAALPEAGESSGPALVLGDFDSLRYADLRSGDEIPGIAPLSRMSTLLCDRFSEDAGFHLDECRGTRVVP